MTTAEATGGAIEIGMGNWVGKTRLSVPRRALRIHTALIYRRQEYEAIHGGTLPKHHASPIHRLLQEWRREAIRIHDCGLQEDISEGLQRRLARLERIAPELSRLLTEGRARHLAASGRFPESAAHLPGQAAKQETGPAASAIPPAAGTPRAQRDHRASTHTSPRPSTTPPLPSATSSNSQEHTA